MPIAGALTPSGTWQTATLAVGPVKFGIGHFFSAVLNFLIIGVVAWRLSKLFIKEEPAAAAPATKTCGFCYMSVDARASRCAHCTSTLSEVTSSGSRAGHAATTP
jgi:large conductance mechanosensitive channel